MSERQKQSVAPTHEQKIPFLSDKALHAMSKKHRRRLLLQGIADKIRANWLFWFFSSHVEDPRYTLQSHSTRNRARYERFRSLVSWSHIARLQSSYAVKLGLGGLVVAPLIATAFLHIPYLKEFGFPKQFGFLFLSGLSFVLSSVLFRLRCPVLLAEMLSNTVQARDSLRRKDMLEALVSTEFANLVTWRSYPVDLAQLMLEHDKDKLAVSMALNGLDPALAGYGPHQFAMIERAIYTFAERKDVKVWTEEFNREDRTMVLVPGYGPRTTYEGARPYIKRLRISKPDSDVLTKQPEVGRDDIILEWHETNLDDVSRMPKKTEINVSISYAEGLHHLFSSDEAADTFALIISRWQDHRRALSRLVMFVLYATSVCLFAAFLWLQSEIVLRALGWI